MGEIIWITLVMWLVACAAFAPLGYFIYVYAKKQGEPFGDIEPHGDSESPLLKAIKNLLSKLKK